MVSLHVKYISQRISLRLSQRRKPLKILKRTAAADLPTTPTTIDYHLIVEGSASEIFHHVLIIVRALATVKLAPFPPPAASHSGRVEGNCAGGRLERHSQTEGQRRQRCTRRSGRMTQHRSGRLRRWKMGARSRTYVAGQPLTPGSGGECGAGSTRERRGRTLHIRWSTRLLEAQAGHSKSKG